MNFSNVNANNFLDELGKKNWEELNQETYPSNACTRLFSNGTIRRQA